MSFDIVNTPSLQAVASEDEQVLMEDLQGRVDAAVRQAEEQHEVVEARQSESAAAGRLVELRRAERALSQCGKTMGEKTSALREAALDSLITSAAEEGGTPVFKAWKELAAVEGQSRQATRAIERLVERLIPAAQIEHLRAQSHAAAAKARALERIVQERAEKVLEQLRDAVSEEVVLPVDLSKGVSGTLLAYVAEFKNQALLVSNNADELEKRERK